VTYRLICALLLLFAARAHAILDEVSWQATRVVRVDGRSFETRVHHAKLRERISAVIDGVELDLVLRYDRKLMWQMTPLFAMAGETDISALDTPATIRVLARERLGEESVGGQRTTRYRVQYRTRSGESREGQYWQNAAGVHVKSRFAVPDADGKLRQVELELRDLRVREQPAELFEVPGDYGVIQVDASAILRGVLGI
jgi:hypothetical protein